MDARVIESDLRLADGRTLHMYDTGSAGSASDDGLVVAWHHGTPNIGAPPEPLFPASDRYGIRWMSHDRPGYGGSTPLADRDIASVADDVASMADALGVQRFAVLGHSSGAAHALACGALLPDRVVAVASISGLAPFTAGGLDWFAGIGPAGQASLTAAVAGREAMERFVAAGDDAELDFTATDWEALSGSWSWFMDVVNPAVQAGPGGLIADDLATVSPWGFSPADVQVPVLFMHGEQDRVTPAAHSSWLADRCAQSELRLSPGDGHISILNHSADAVEWLTCHAAV